jgi:mannose-1-phosphate guanylyltransferase
MLQLGGMKLIVFCGGSGTRLWPLSRREFPKQFIKMFGDKSTFQLVIDRVAPVFGLENIIISTISDYKKLITDQIPDLPTENIILEPEKRDLAPAVGFNLIHLKKHGYSGPVALLWADHLMDNVPHFIESLKAGEKICTENPKKVVFISEKPRFANNNLGWIHFGNKNADGSNQFVGWKYKPEYSVCEQMFASGEWDWNPGYVVEDLDNALELFKLHSPEISQRLDKIYEAFGTKQQAQIIADVYPTMPKISHDNAISEHLSTDDAVVVRCDMGWSDPGTLYALKEALAKQEADNLEIGSVTSLDTTDSLIANQEKDKIVATVGVSGMVVVNTPDVLLVVPKTEILKVTDLVNQLSENSDTKKYT